MSDERHELSRTWRYGLLNAEAFYFPGLKPLTRLVYAALTTFAGADRSAWPTKQRIAHDLGIAENSVRAGLAELEAAGLIRTVRRTLPSGADRPSLITLLDSSTGVHQVQGEGAPGEPSGGAPGAGGRVHQVQGEGAPGEPSGGAPGAPITITSRTKGPGQDHLNLWQVAEAVCITCRCLHNGRESCRQAAARRAGAGQAATTGRTAIREAISRLPPRSGGDPA